MSSIVKKDINQEIRNLNECFLQSHRLRKELAIKYAKETIPVLLVNGDNLILHYKDERREYSYLPPLYHHLKTIAHSPCTLHNLDTLLKAGVDCSELRTKCLTQIRETIVSLEEVDHPLKEHCEILKQIVDHSEMRSCTAALKPGIDRLINEAARCRINALQEVTEKIRSEMEEDCWKRIAVIVLGPPLPRTGDVAMQYFSSILKLRPPSSSLCPHLRQQNASSYQRLIYAESIWTEKEAIGLLATHIADEELGEVFLQDPNAMHQDILSAAGAAHLEMLGLMKK
jgi:hypothetical protein